MGSSTASPVWPACCRWCRWWVPRRDFQPIFVGDVAQAVAQALDGKARPARFYELGGPEVRSFRDLVAYVCEVIGRKRLLLPLPFGVARMQAGLMEFANTISLGLMPASLMLTRDQVKLLAHDKRRQRRREGGRPHDRGARHHADLRRHDRPVLSVAFPPDRQFVTQKKPV